MSTGTIFVTGGSGFLGQPLVRLMINKGYVVRTLARSQNSQSILESFGAEVVQGDLLNYELLERSMNNCQAVFHLAGSPSFRLIDHRKIRQIHINGTHNVIKAVERNNIPRLIYCSSIGALAAAEQKYRDTSQYVSVYEQAKLEAHNEIFDLSKRRQGIIIALPAYVMGPGGHDILGAYIKAFCKRRLPFVIRLEQPMSYVYVDDVADGLFRCLIKGKSGAMYVLSSEHCTPMQLVELMEQYCHVKRPAITLNPNLAKPLLLLDEILASFTGRHPYMTIELLRILESRPWVFSAEQTKKELDWNPRNLREMLEQTIESFN